MLESSRSLSSPVSFSTRRDTNISSAPIAPTTPTITTTSVWSSVVLEVDELAALVLFSSAAALLVDALAASNDSPVTLCSPDPEADQALLDLASKCSGCGGGACVGAAVDTGVGAGVGAEVGAEVATLLVLPAVLVVRS